MLRSGKRQELRRRKMRTAWPLWSRRPLRPTVAWRVNLDACWKLHDFLRPMGVSLLETLGLHLKTWILGQTRNREAVALIVLRIPVRRSDKHPPERMEVRAFAVDRPVKELAEVLGVVVEEEGHRGALIGSPNMISSAERVPLCPLNPVRDLSRQSARILTGNRHKADPRIVAIGTGALGSQTLLNLVRGGFGRWTVVDRDVLLPHNLVRHALPRAFVGSDKAGSAGAPRQRSVRGRRSS